MISFSYDEVKEAYIKLKTYVYYDSTNLFLRKQLAVFETDLIDEGLIFGSINNYSYYAKIYDVDLEAGQLWEKKLRTFTQAINNYHEIPKYFDQYLNRIETKILPKKIKDKNSQDNFISNVRISDEYEVQRSTIFIDAPIEIHLITVLWLLREGVK